MEPLYRDKIMYTTVKIVKGDYCVDSVMSTEGMAKLYNARLRSRNTKKIAA